MHLPEFVGTSVCTAYRPRKESKRPCLPSACQHLPTHACSSRGSSVPNTMPRSTHANKMHTRPARCIQVLLQILLRGISVAGSYRQTHCPKMTSITARPVQASLGMATNSQTAVTDGSLPTQTRTESESLEAWHTPLYGTVKSAVSNPIL